MPYAYPWYKNCTICTQSSCLVLSLSWHVRHTDLHQQQRRSGVLYRTSQTRTSQTRTSQTRTSQTRPCKARPRPVRLRLGQSAAARDAHLAAAIRDSRKTSVRRNHSAASSQLQVTTLRRLVPTKASASNMSSHATSPTPCLAKSKTTVLRSNARPTRAQK